MNSKIEQVNYLLDKLFPAPAYKGQNIVLAQEIDKIYSINVPTDMVEDGFGRSAPAVCSMCGCRAVYVCRPGDIRCGVCYDNNPKEWYTGQKCTECGYMAIHNNKCLVCASFSTIPDDLMLTDEEFTDWEMKFCETNHISFPLHGQYRDDQLKLAQLSKFQPIIEKLKQTEAENKGLKRELHGLSDNFTDLINTCRTKDERIKELEEESKQ